MATTSHLGGRGLDPFLHALHSSTSVDAVQKTCARFAGELIPAQAYGWYQFRRGTTEPDVISARGVTDGFLARYESEGRAKDPLFAKVAAKLTTASSDHHLNTSERRSFNFQREISSGCIERAIQAPLAVAGELLGSINVARGPNAPAFNDNDSTCLALIARHASIAFARARREDELGRRCSFFEAAMDVLDQPFVLTGPDGEVVFANRAALLATGTSPELRDKLQQAAALPAAETGGMAVTTVAGHANESSVTVRSVRLGGTGALVSFFYSPSNPFEPSLTKLTSREREIAQFVVRGLSNGDIALAASISRNTVKRHLKNVFEKLQLGSRAELAAAVARSEAASATPSRDAPAASRVSDVSVPSRSSRRP